MHVSVVVVVVVDSDRPNDEQAKPTPEIYSAQNEGPSQHSPRAPEAKLRHVSPEAKHVSVVVVVVVDSDRANDEQAKPTPETNSEQDEGPSQHSPRAPVAKLRHVSPEAKQVSVVVVVVVDSLSAGSA